MNRLLILCLSIVSTLAPPHAQANENNQPYEMSDTLVGVINGRSFVPSRAVDQNLIDIANEFKKALHLALGKISGVPSPYAEKLFGDEVRKYFESEVMKLVQMNVLKQETDGFDFVFKFVNSDTMKFTSPVFQNTGCDGRTPNAFAVASKPDLCDFVQIAVVDYEELASPRKRVTFYMVPPVRASGTSAIVGRQFTFGFKAKLVNDAVFEISSQICSEKSEIVAYGGGVSAGCGVKRSFTGRLSLNLGTQRQPVYAGTAVKYYSGSDGARKNGLAIFGELKIPLNPPTTQHASGN